ncbi:MAG: hypothetical protein HFJ48_03860 [Clostridia bacterium]|nr:hypothetical protein [Clostridia bacterium]
MYNNVYEDYIRSMIGRNTAIPANDYSNCGNNMYNGNIYENDIYGSYEFDNNFMNAQMLNPVNTNFNLEECYPELYRLLYPMIQKVCMKCTRSLSKDVINEMVEEVYSNFVGNEGELTQININLSNEVGISKSTTTSNVQTNRDTSVTDTRTNTSLNRNNNSIKSVDKKNEDRSENRQARQRNPILNDLIRILILRELLGRPGGNVRPPIGRPPHQRPPHHRLYNSYSSDMFEDKYNIF